MPETCCPVLTCTAVHLVPAVLPDVAQEPVIEVLMEEDDEGDCRIVSGRFPLGRLAPAPENLARTVQQARRRNRGALGASVSEAVYQAGLTMDDLSDLAANHQIHITPQGVRIDASAADDREPAIVLPDLPVPPPLGGNMFPWERAAMLPSLGETAEDEPTEPGGELMTAKWRRILSGREVTR